MTLVLLAGDVRGPHSHYILREVCLLVFSPQSRSSRASFESAQHPSTLATAVRLPPPPPPIQLVATPPLRNCGFGRGWLDHRFFSRRKLDAYKAYLGDAGTFLVPFRGISPTIKSLDVYLTVLLLSRVFNLILSFPLLEDLTLTGNNPSIRNVDGPDGLSTIRNLTLMVCDDEDHLLVFGLLGSVRIPSSLSMSVTTSSVVHWYLHPHR